LAVFQARAKWFKIQRSRPRLQPNSSKKKALISFDSLVRIEPFQGVVLTPQGKKSLSAPYPLAAKGVSIGD
jgi:hypothetical protein